ncbi:MAG: DEAD/DEAH box helicase family protein, partial [Proteobacteria bacterium]|nr:DEAD/DEAH box helicase family protein [Pseudomonadota bacterium]
IEAALFAVRSPISKGVILADEVGLGKTIEAGLVLCQLWAEHNRKLLIICPASLRKQWSFELREKFNLPSEILDAKTYNKLKRNGEKYPFKQNSVIIASYHFIASHKEEVKAIGWDLVTMDEAHKLRNCYRETNKIGQAVRLATEGIKKILLTATPLQNSLLELYGLCSLIDERIFGNLASFKSQYTTSKSDLPDLRDRLKPFCKRTLREQVLEYVPYTERNLMTHSFHPTDEEHELYEAVSSFLLKESTYAIPHAHKHLTILVARKLLASSPYAIAKTLETMASRMHGLKEGKLEEMNYTQSLIEQEDFQDYAEDYEEDLSDTDFETFQDSGRLEPPPPSDAALDLAQLDAQNKEVEQLSKWAKSIRIDEKMRTLLKSLKIGFNKMADMGAAQKSLIFTESRRTQDALRDLLEANGYAGKIVLFNGSNNDDDSKKIYADWVEKNQDTGRAS